MIRQCAARNIGAFFIVLRNYSYARDMCHTHATFDLDADRTNQKFRRLDQNNSS